MAKSKFEINEVVQFDLNKLPKYIKVEVDTWAPGYTVTVCSMAGYSSSYNIKVQFRLAVSGLSQTKTFSVTSNCLQAIASDQKIFKQIEGKQKAIQILKKEIEVLESKAKLLKELGVSVIDEVRLHSAHKVSKNLGIELSKAYEVLG